MTVRLAHSVTRSITTAQGTRIELGFGRADDTVRVPGLLLLPAQTARPSAGALLLHGFSSRKEQMADTVGAALLSQGIASLSIDLPLHGARIDEGNETSWGLVGGYERAFDARAMQNPLALAGAWRTAQRDARLALAYFGARAEVDRDRLAIVGYSMGSFLGVHVAAEDRAVRALVLAAGGDLPERLPYARALRLMSDPLRAVGKLNGRPLLMLHGRQDSTVRPDQAQRLFDAAQEPKELRWYEAGHQLPAHALDDAATWLSNRLSPALASELHQ